MNLGSSAHETVGLQVSYGSCLQETFQVGLLLCQCECLFWCSESLQQAWKSSFNSFNGYSSMYSTIESQQCHSQHFAFSVSGIRVTIFTEANAFTKSPISCSVRACLSCFSAACVNEALIKLLLQSSLSVCGPRI